MDYEDFDYVNYGDLFFQLAQEKWAVADEIKRIDMRDLSRPVVVDTHFTIATPVGFYPGFPEYIIDKIPAVAWVLIEGEPEEIEARREKDKDIRKRGGGIEDDIWTHQDLNRSAALLYAYRTNGAVYIIHNKQGKLDEAAIFGVEERQKKMAEMQKRLKEDPEALTEEEMAEMTKHMGVMMGISILSLILFLPIYYVIRARYGVIETPLGKMGLSAAGRLAVA